MPTDYKIIAEENIRRYGTDIDEYGPVLLSNRYSDRTHFVYELLQNAEDAIGWRLDCENGFSRDVIFQLDSHGLLVRHFGLPFGEEHVRGICNIGKGTKRQDLSAIGKHGIGFKSVYAYSHHPEVHSGDEHFVIDSFVRPCSVPAKGKATDETKFILPFDHPEVPEGEAYGEIAERLQGLGLRTLLFLRNVDSISWQLACGANGQYLREAKTVKDGIDRVTLLGQDGTETEEQWLVFRKPITNDGQPAGFAEVAFLISRDEKSGEDRISAVSESPLVVFFPTEKETHFGFLIQGPYRTTPSRDNIPRDDRWNKYLVSQTAEVLIWALAELRELKLMSVGALEALIVDLHKYEPGSQAAMFRPIADAIVTTLKGERLIPSFRGGHLPGSAACIARAESLRSLISHAQLTEITGSKAGWVTGEITRDRTPALRSFLVDSVGVSEFDGEDFVRDVRSGFLQRQSDQWIAKFYAFLLDQHAIRRRPWFSGKKIVRLRNGSHVAPFNSEGLPNAYLPGAGRTEFPTVKKSVCQEDALKFLVQLGLKPPDPVDDVVRNVLPKYQGDEVDVSDADYAADILRILDGFATDSKGQREKLVAALRETSFVMSVDAGNSSKFVSKPGEVYLATDRLKHLFAGVPDVFLVDDDYVCLRGENIRELLEACGAVRFLRPLADSSLSWDERSRLRAQAGHAETSGYRDRVTDWMLDGLEKLLQVMPDLSAKVRANKAKLLWEELVHLEERRSKSLFTGDYSWTHYGSYRKAFDAAFVRKLNKTAWIPHPDGELQRPELVLFDTLNWKPSPFLQSKIRFKPPVIEALAKEAGIEPGILDLLKKLGLTSEAELRSRLGVDDQSEAEDTNEATDASEVDAAADSADVEDAIENPVGDTAGRTPAISDVAGTEPTIGGTGPTGSELGHPGPNNGRDSVTSGAAGKSKGNATGVGKGGKSPGASRGREDTPGTKGSPSGVAAKPFISYVVTHPNEEEPDPDGLQHEARMALEGKAINLILAIEPKLKRTPPHNPGYDLFEANADDEAIRRVEVKAMTGDLRGRPVGLSRTQFECAREYREAYWLYVVEYAGDPQNARIIRIQDPAGKARTFCFDHGWISVAELYAPVT